MGTSTVFQKWKYRRHVGLDIETKKIHQHFHTIYVVTEIAPINTYNQWNMFQKSLVGSANCEDRIRTDAQWRTLRNDVATHFSFLEDTWHSHISVFQLIHYILKYIFYLQPRRKRNGRFVVSLITPRQCLSQQSSGLFKELFCKPKPHSVIVSNVSLWNKLKR